MITKSKTFYVEKYDLINLSSFRVSEHKSPVKNLEITISWQEEEQKVEITKSMIMEIRDEYLEGNNNNRTFSKYLINKLFNKGE